MALWEKLRIKRSEIVRIGGESATPITIQVQFTINWQLLHLQQHPRNAETEEACTKLELEVPIKSHLYPHKLKPIIILIYFSLFCVNNNDEI